MDVKEIKDKIKAANVDSLRIDFPDLHGICRSKLVPAGRLEEVLEEGCNHVTATYAVDFANDVAMGTGLGDEIQWRDMTIKPDPATFAVLPYMEGTACPTWKEPLALSAMHTDRTANRSPWTRDLYYSESLSAIRILVSILW
jgi:glutamine synthetase